MRPLALADAERAAEVVAALEEEHGSRPMTGPAQVRIWWERAELEAESWVVEDDGQMVALAWLERRGDVPEAIVTVHPRHTGRGLGLGLLDRAEARARRRGLGLALLLHTFAEFRRRGKERAGLGVDAENPTGATRLYERAGMHVAIEEVVFEKALT